MKYKLSYLLCCMNVTNLKGWETDQSLPTQKKPPSCNGKKKILVKPTDVLWRQNLCAFPCFTSDKRSISVNKFFCWNTPNNQYYIHLIQWMWKISSQSKEIKTSLWWLIQYFTHIHIFTTLLQRISSTFKIKCSHYVTTQKNSKIL